MPNNPTSRACQNHEVCMQVYRIATSPEFALFVRWLSEQHARALDDLVHAHSDSILHAQGRAAALQEILTEMQACVTLVQQEHQNPVGVPRQF